MNDVAYDISSIVRNSLNALKVEDLVIEALRDLMKDEIKRHIRNKLERDTQLQAEIRAAITELLEAKVRETYALVRIGKCGAELGISIVPDEMKKRIEKDIADLLEREVERMIEEL